MSDDRNTKRYKTLHSWYNNTTLSSVSVSEHENEDEHINIIGDFVDNIVNQSLKPSSPLNDQYVESEKEYENQEDVERDPGKRRPICSYPLNERDNIRRLYVGYGPCQPHLYKYPRTQHGNQTRGFCYNWFKFWPWLEYSCKEDKIYCFPCFLFDEYPSRHPSFTEVGFSGWKNILSKQSGILVHIGGVNSNHNASMHKWGNLKNPTKHVERVINTLSSQDLANNRLRLVATIEVVRLLARQGCSFRGHDESVDSLNGGNFQAVLNSFRKMNEEINKVINSAPGNAKYTCPKIQKQIANILGNKVRGMIRDEIGDSMFSILVDEARDVADKEQMALIIRFVDREGLIRERFFKIVSVGDTCSKTLKDEIDKIFTQYDLHPENIRGQGYDGASNMRGQFNGLQALFLQECPCAYYVHCFAHRLQLALNGAAKGVHDLWQFFSTLTMIVNFVDSSAKRHFMLKACREGEIADLLAIGSLETGSGKNQACTLQRAGATHWGSHFRSISSLIKLFGATRATIDDLYISGADEVQGEAKAIGKALKKFDFVYCLHMMYGIMRITDFLSQTLKKKDIDILNAIHSLSITKVSLEEMRESGWDNLMMKVTAFCLEHAISMPDMSAPYKKGLRNCDKNITNEHYYRINVFFGVIDFQLSELDSRFTESSLEILVLGTSFDPRHNLRAFKRDDVCKLALKYYPLDFSSNDMIALDLECEFFVKDVQTDPRFETTTSASDLCHRMVDFGKTLLYPMIYRLICLILTLPVSTATTERAFSSMNIIKTKLRNKMNDEFLDDLMVLYIERAYAESIDTTDVIAEFELTKRRVNFS